MVRTRTSTTKHETLVATWAFEGCKSVEIYLDQDNTDVIVLWEKWESRAHSEKYLAWRVATGLLQELSVVLAALAQIWHFDEVGA